MSAPAFTPGPWDCTGCLFPDDDLGGVYYRLQAEGMDARAANARLIAAAPEMYEALELLASLSKGLVGSAYTNDAEAALAKARGEQ